MVSIITLASRKFDEIYYLGILSIQIGNILLSSFLRDDSDFLTLEFGLGEAILSFEEYSITG